MKRSWLLAAAAILLTGAPAGAQRTIAEGMTEAQVRETFGAPATTRSVGAWTYWYYHNGCPRTCGSDDVVFFRDRRVVAAVLRTGARRFSGPRADRALEAADAAEERDGAGLHVPAGEAITVGGVRVESRPAAEFVVQPTADTELVVNPAVDPAPGDEPVSSVDRAHQRNVEQSAERETATERARRLREERQP
jgi:hypothetical protein